MNGGVALTLRLPCHGTAHLMLETEQDLGGRKTPNLFSWQPFLSGHPNRSRGVPKAELASALNLSEPDLKHGDVQTFLKGQSLSLAVAWGPLELQVTESSPRPFHIEKKREKGNANIY